MISRILSSIQSVLGSSGPELDASGAPVIVVTGPEDRAHALQKTLKEVLGLSVKELPEKLARQKKDNGLRIYASRELESSELPFDGLQMVPFLTSPTLWKLKERPKTLLIVGEGPLADLFSNAFRKVGTEVQNLTTKVKFFEHVDKKNFCVTEIDRKDTFVEFDLVLLV